jgi:hypothetical protein
MNTLSNMPHNAHLQAQLSQRSGSSVQMQVAVRIPSDAGDRGETLRRELEPARAEVVLFADVDNVLHPLGAAAPILPPRQLAAAAMSAVMMSICPSPFTSARSMALVGYCVTMVWRVPSPFGSRGCSNQ